MDPSPALIIGHGATTGDKSPLAHYVRLTLMTVDRPKSLVLYGPTRTGKTVWARSLAQKHLYFCGMYSGAEAMKAHDASMAIFDDIAGGIKFFPMFKNWLGCQVQFQIKVLYRDPIIIDWGKPCIWISNTDPRHDMSHEDVDWMNGNCIFVEIIEPLFLYLSCQ